MSQTRILHLMHWDPKFVPSMIRFVHEHFDATEHSFVVYGNSVGEIDAQLPVTSCKRLFDQYSLNSELLKTATRIVIHGLFKQEVLLFLALNASELSKAYWVMWGGDLYTEPSGKKKLSWYSGQWLRRRVIPRIGHLATYIPGDYDYARATFGARGQRADCLMYQSNVFHPPVGGVETSPKNSTLKILIGNSADPSNRHLEVFDQLERSPQQDFVAYVPLSYGCQKTRDQVVEQGRRRFGDRFHPLLEILTPDQYWHLLENIDIGIFNHKRQQGMGNMISLLGYGARVHLRSEVTPWHLFRQLGCEVTSTESLDLSRLPESVSIRNRGIIEDHFSLARLLDQWGSIFRGD